MADTTLHGNGQRLVNTQDGVQLEIERTASRLGKHQLPRLHHLGLADEHHERAAGVGSVLGTRVCKHTHALTHARANALIYPHATWLKLTISTSILNPRHQQTQG